MDREHYSNCTFNIFYRDIYHGIPGRHIPPMYGGNTNEYYTRPPFQPQIQRRNYRRNMNPEDAGAIRVYPRFTEVHTPSNSMPSDTSYKTAREKTFNTVEHESNSNLSTKGGRDGLPSKPASSQESNKNLETERKQTSKSTKCKSNSNVATIDNRNCLPGDPALPQHSNMFAEKETEQASKTVKEKNNSNFSTKSGKDNVSSVQTFPQHSKTNLETETEQTSETVGYETNSNLLSKSRIDSHSIPPGFKPLPQRPMKQRRMLACQTPSHSSKKSSNSEPLFSAASKYQPEKKTACEMPQNDEKILDQRRPQDLSATSQSTDNGSEIQIIGEYMNSPLQNLGSVHELTASVVGNDKTTILINSTTKDKNDADQFCITDNNQGDTDFDSTTYEKINEEPLYSSQGTAISVLSNYKKCYWTIYSEVKPFEFFTGSFNKVGLSEEIWSLYRSDHLTYDTFAEKICVCEKLFTEIQNKSKWSDEEFKFYLVGSVITGLARTQSDINIVALLPAPLFSDENQITGQSISITEFLKHLSSICYVKDIKTEYNTKPKIQFVWKDYAANSSFNFNIRLNDNLELTRTQLNLLYCKCDWRFQALFFVLKIWAECHGLINRPDSLLSSYSISLLLIYFLQKGTWPPVLPVLHNQMADFSLSLSGNEVNPIDISKTSHLKWKSCNNASLGELLLWFFRFYDNYEFPGMIIDIAIEDPIKRKEEALGAYLHIEDPLNIGNIVKVPNNYEDCTPFLSGIKRAHKALKKDRSFKSILSSK